MTNKKSSYSISLPLITLIFVVLKLTGVIDWSWIWVTCPLWIPIVMVLVILFCIIGFVLGLILFGVDRDKIKEGLTKLNK